MQREERYAFDRQKSDALAGHCRQRGGYDIAAGTLSRFDRLRDMRQAPALECAPDQRIAGIQPARFFLLAKGGNGGLDEMRIIKAMQRGYLDLTVLRQQP